MKGLKEFEISFVGLKEGVHHFEYIVEKEFFDFFGYEEFYNSNVKVDLSFFKKATMFELEFSILGWVEVACDLTNELFQLPINSKMDLIVKFGDEYNDENEELLIIPHTDYKLNVAQFIYETIALSVPLKKIHPGVADGTLKSEVLEKLKEFEIKGEVEKQTPGENINETIDPRWNKLKDILIDKNKSNGTS